MSTDVKLLKKPKASLPCISLIGMAGSGKTTIGVALARALGWAFITLSFPTPNGWRYGGNSWEKMAMILFWESVLPFSSLSGTWDW